VQPLNVKELFGNRYRIECDPAAKSEPYGRRNPWNFIIQCKYGEIYPFSDQLLAVLVVGPKKVAQLRRVGYTLHQDADGEAVYLFPADRFDDVARLVHPRKRKRISTEHLRKLQQGGSDYRKTG